MTPQILYRLAPGTTIRFLAWDGGGTNAAFLRFLGIVGNSATFAVQAITVRGPAILAVPIGTVLTIPVTAINTVGI